MLKNHSFGILTAWKHCISIGPLEGVNTRAKLIKRIAYGYKSFEYFALKLKAAFPGRSGNPLLLLGEWTAVIKSRLCHTGLGMERESQLFFNDLGGVSRRRRGCGPIRFRLVGMGTRVLAGAPTRRRLRFRELRGMPALYPSQESLLTPTRAPTGASYFPKKSEEPK